MHSRLHSSLQPHPSIYCTISLLYIRLLAHAEEASAEASTGPAEESSTEPASTPTVEVVAATEPAAVEEEATEPAVAAAVEAEMQAVGEEAAAGVVDEDAADPGK